MGTSMTAHTEMRARSDVHRLRVLLLALSVTCSFGGPEQHFLLHILTPESLPTMFPFLPRGSTCTGAFNATDVALYRGEENFSLNFKE